MRSKTFTLGNHIITITMPKLPVRVSTRKDAFEFNGHLLTSHYGNGGPDIWPNYALCFRCGHSYLGGADAVFSALSCKQMRREDGRRFRG